MRISWLLLLALCVAAGAQTLVTKTFSTTGHPTEALGTPDGQYVLVTVDRQGGGGGIDVFHVEGDKLKRVAYQALGGAGAQGILLIPHTQMLAVGVSDAGVAFLPLEDTLRGKAKAGALPQGDRSGTGYLAVTPDGQYLFAANEYGEGGNVAVIALHRDEAGAVHPELLAKIPTPNTTPGVVISPDGTRVYAVGEVTRADVAARLPGHGVKELERDGCVQGRPDRTNANGVLYAIDVAKAEAMTRDALPEQLRGTVTARVDAGCSPVREAVTADGAMVYVTARGDDRVLVFDAKALESDREHAFVRAISSGGDAPVGLKLFGDGKGLLVANSNRFSGGAGNVSVFDLSDAAKPVLRQTIKTGAFPRNITSSADGKTLYLTVFNGDELMVLRVK
jgi:DNA-binding beta-propeller fold protein YncE